MNVLQGHCPGSGTPAAPPTPRDRPIWATLAAAPPSATTVSALENAMPTEMPGADLIDAIVTCERAISHLQAMQASLTAAFARPGVAGDLTELIDSLTRQRGAARGPDGRVDPDLLAAHQQDYARSLAATEIAAALHIPHRTASSRVDSARELVEQLPTTWDALRSGEIDHRRADVIAAGTRCLPGPVRAAAEAAVAPLAHSRIPRHVQELLDRAVIAADPDAAVTREQEARRQRSVRHYPDRNGMGKIHADLTAEGAATVYTLLDLLAQAAAEVKDPDGSRRGIDARRADALTDIAAELLSTGQIDLAVYGRHADVGGGRGEDANDDNPDDHNRDAHPTGHDQPTGDDNLGGDDNPGNPDDHNRDAHPTGHDQPTGDDNPGRPVGEGRRNSSGSAPGAASVEQNQTSAGPAWRGLSRHGRRPHLVVTVGLSTLAGLDRMPGHLAGHGAITAELALNIAAAYETLALAGIDPRTGTAAAVTSTVYRRRQSLSDQIATLAPQCRFPSCRQPAWRSDHDHRIPFNHQDPESGGLTSLWDCDPECRRHHLLKTHAHWTADGQPDRTIVWTSPTGHRYASGLPELRIPGEGTDPDWTDLIVPATWPAPPPPPPDESPCGASSSDRSDLGRGDPEPEFPGGDGAAAPVRIEEDDVAPPSPEMREYLARMRQHDLQVARFRSIGARLCRALRSNSLRAAADAATCGRARPAPADSADTTPGNAPPRRLPSRRDRADQASIERAIRDAAGLPDPNDEPPPF